MADTLRHAILFFDQENSFKLKSPKNYYKFVIFMDMVIIQQ